nr:TetR family transcriptional regulator C-terminal domain-containing protein [Escherichia coli]
MDSLTTVYPLSDAITVAEKLLSGWEGAVMRSKLYCSTEPVYDFWSYFKTSVRYQSSQEATTGQ